MTEAVRLNCLSYRDVSTYLETLWRRGRSLLSPDSPWVDIHSSSFYGSAASSVHKLMVTLIFSPMKRGTMRFSASASCS